MLSRDINTMRRMPLAEIPNQPVELVVEWLKTQPDSVGEAVAKLCYQRITNQN